MKQIKLKQINIRIFSGAVLKYIAMLTMLIDHIGATGLIFLSVGAGMSTRLYFISRMIGRIAFPIYVFLLVEGFVHTKNIKKYIIRSAPVNSFILLLYIPYFDKSTLLFFTSIPSASSNFLCSPIPPKANSGANSPFEFTTLKHGILSGSGFL